jgi:hypothetical protein
MSNVFGPIIGDLAADFAMITQSGRMIGDIILQVVVDKVRRDELIATTSPSLGRPEAPAWPGRDEGERRSPSALGDCAVTNERRKDENRQR